MNEIAQGMIQRDAFWFAIGFGLLLLFVGVAFAVIWVGEIIKKLKRKKK